MSRFVLIHGGLHGSWCWHRLEPELHRLDHRTVTMDLPVECPGKGLDDYADVVLAAMPEGQSILVAHSLGGFVAPRVVQSRPDCRIVMLCAGFPPTSDAERVRIDASDFPGMIRDDQDRIHAPPELAIAAFYAGVPAELAQEAARRVRPQWIGAFTDDSLVPSYADKVIGVIACAQDGIAPVADQQERARRLWGLEPIVLPGGHSPFLAHPRELALALDELARADRSPPDH